MLRAEDLGKAVDDLLVQLRRERDAARLRKKVPRSELNAVGVDRDDAIPAVAEEQDAVGDLPSDATQIAQRQPGLLVAQSLQRVEESFGAALHELSGQLGYPRGAVPPAKLPQPLLRERRELRY
jgi:hypothetical protein